ESRSSKNDVALFIDWENLRYSLWKKHLIPNLTALMEIVGRFGRPVVARSYADWLDQFFLKLRDQMHLYQAGIEPVYVPARTEPDAAGRRKNSIDVKMSSDCMEVSYTNANIKTFVLVSGDADFLHVANSLRRMGREVIVIGVSWSTSSRISERVDELIYYDEEIAEAEAPPVRQAVRARAAAAAAAGLPAASGKDLDAVLAALVGLVKEQRAQGSYPLLAWLGTQIRRRMPNFHLADYQFSKFKDLLKHAEERGLLKIVTRDLVDWALLPGEELLDEEELADAPCDPESSPGGNSTRDSNHAGEPEAAARAAPTDPWAGAENPVERCPALFADLVRAACEVEQSSTFTFMTMGFISKILWKKANHDTNGLPPGATIGSPQLEDLTSNQFKRLVDRAVQQNLLLSSSRLDAGTGKLFWTVRLNRDHPFVASTLAEPVAPAPLAAAAGEPTTGAPPR
ncbi:MAG TPA: NYN domain-containing protein, partial [Isosphaeraceae bacterium]|nr:NYN domain-containing protein [Isosphaeraceae bacterium]